MEAIAFMRLLLYAINIGKVECLLEGILCIKG